MPRINSMMDIGKRSMQNAGTGLQVVSHNIANKSTEGFSRQNVDLVTAVPINEGRYQLGMGSRAASVSRTNNPFLEKQIQKETGNLGFAQGKTPLLDRLQEVFNEQANKGLNQHMADFFNSFRELAATPESLTARTMVKESSVALASQFKAVSNQLEGIRTDADQSIKNQVYEINKMVKEVAQLNEQIASTEMQGIPANDQRDSRELLLKKLNEKIDIHVAEGSGGMVVVSTAGNAILVSGLDNYDLLAGIDPSTARMEILYKQNDSTPPFKITDRVKGGSIGGAIEARDGIITGVAQKIDQMALTLAKEVNQVHAQGFDKKGGTGLDFFVLDQDSAASTMSLNKEIASDVYRIATAAQPKADGDNTVANVISQIQYRSLPQVLPNSSREPSSTFKEITAAHQRASVAGKSTIDDFYNSIVGTVGVIAQRANTAEETQKNVLQQMGKIRDSVSGVNLDEEVTKMIEFQRAYDASARVIKTADEMFDTVLGLKRL